QVETLVVGPPQAQAPADERAQPMEHVIEPSYGRRSIMQMEFPCSLNCTASTSLRMRKRPRPRASSSCSGLIGSGTAVGSNPGPSSVTFTLIESGTSSTRTSTDL